MALLDFDPPGIVSEDRESMNALVQEAKFINATILQSEHANMQRAFDLGKLLIRIRTKCKPGEWKSCLEMTGISKTRAWEYRQIAGSAARDVVDAKSIREAMKIIGDNPEPDESQALEKKYCSRNCRTGQGPKDCQDCKKLNKTQVETSAPARTKPDPKPPEPEEPPAEEVLVQAEPGELADEEDDLRERPFIKKAEGYVKRGMNLNVEILRRCELSKTESEQLSDSWTAYSEALASASKRRLKPAKPPRIGRCKYCKQSVLWVQTVKNKNMPLDPEKGTGTWDIQNNVAIQVQWDRDGKDFYRRHECRGER